MFSHVIEVGYCFLFIFCILFLDILWKFMVRVSYKTKSKNNFRYNILQKIFFEDIKYQIAKSIYILNYILTCLFLAIFESVPFAFISFIIVLGVTILLFILWIILNERTTVYYGAIYFYLQQF